MSLLLSLLLSAPAYPCAAIFVEDGGTASTDAQEVIFDQGDGFTDVSYRVEVRSSVQRLGWIVPIFGEFVELADADLDRFDALRARTAPQVYIETEGAGDGGGGGGCSGASKGSDRAGGNAFDTGGEQGLGVDVVAEGFTGTYEWTVIQGDDEDAVLTWLEDNGFGIGPSGPAIRGYVQEGGVSFAAITVADVVDQQLQAELPGVRIRYQGDSMRFPATMAEDAMPDEVSTRIFVVGDQRARIDGWISRPLGTVYVDGASNDVDQVYADALRGFVGDAQVYAEIWSGEDGGQWVTRFDTIAKREAHSSDPTWTVDGGTDRTESELWLTGRMAQGALWLLPGLVGLSVGLRRRRASAPTSC